MLLGEANRATLVLSRYPYCCVVADLPLSGFLQPDLGCYSPHGDYPNAWIPHKASRLANYFVCHIAHCSTAAARTDLERLDTDIRWTGLVQQIAGSARLIFVFSWFKE